jgi:hypothetical protein
LTGSHPLGAFRRVIYLLEDAPRLLQKQLARSAEFDSTRKTVEQFEANLLPQILNLSGECRLGDTQSLRAAPVMLLLPDGHEVAQMSQFHSDSLSALIR